MGDISLRDIGRDFTTGLRGVNETIARREAGILGALSGKVSGFLGQLLAADVDLADEDGGGDAGFRGGGPGVGAGEYEGQHSSDGMYVWTGNSWNLIKPIDDGTGKGDDGVPLISAPSTPGTSIGQISADGSFTWDGSQWNKVSRSAGRQFE